MVLRPSPRWLRGQRIHHRLAGDCHRPVDSNFTGIVVAMEPVFETFANARPVLPRRMRCIPERDVSLPMLYDRQEQLMVIENALAHRRVENQVSQALSQLSLAHRNAEYFVEHHILDREVRPSIHAMWFHDRGLRGQQAVLSSLGTHHLVPIFSLLSYDFEHGKMSLVETEQLYCELMDSSVAHHKQVQRELANGMVRTYALSNEFDKGLEVLKEMKRKNIRRTFVSYSPLFRLARLNEDAAMHERLEHTLLELEGGPMNKLLWIDVPRIMYAFGVFIRFYWWWIATVLMASSSLCVMIVLRTYNYA